MRNAGGWYSFSFLSYISPPLSLSLSPAADGRPTSSDPTHYTDGLHDRFLLLLVQSKIRPTAESFLNSPADLFFFFLLLLSFIRPPLLMMMMMMKWALRWPSLLQQPTVAGPWFSYTYCGHRWTGRSYICICCSDTWMEVQSVGCCCPRRCFHFTWIDTLLLLCEFLFSSPCCRPPKTNDLWWRWTSRGGNNGLFLFFHLLRLMGVITDGSRVPPTQENAAAVERWLCRRK